MLKIENLEIGTQFGCYECFDKNKELINRIQFTAKSNQHGESINKDYPQITLESDIDLCSNCLLKLLTNLAENIKNKYYEE